MIPIQYEEFVQKNGVVVKASVKLADGTMKSIYGKTREEARQKLIDWLGCYYDLAPESFVTLPQPGDDIARYRISPRDRVAVVVLFIMILAALSLLGSALEKIFG